MTLDNVSCLLHHPIDVMLLSHESISWDDAVEMMMWYLGSTAGDALKEVTETRGAYARFSYLRKILKQRLQLQLELDIEGGMEEEVQSLQDQALHIYLLFLVGITVFINKSVNYVDVVYLRLLLVFHGELRAYLTCIWSLTMLPIGHVVSYQDTCLCCRYKLIIMFVFSFISFDCLCIYMCLSLLQALIYQHFRGIGSKDVWGGYQEDYPLAMLFAPRMGLSTPDE